jgi:bifunctional enzyme CysN/CysC
LVGYDQGVFEAIADDYTHLAHALGIPHVQCIPLSALKGQNLVHRGESMPWYDGPALLEYLDTVEIERPQAEGGFRLPVQWVQRPDRRDADRDFRGYAGTLVAGSVKPGDAVVVLPSGRRSHIARVLGPEGALDGAVAGQAVMLVLDDEVDVSRGDVIATAEDAPEVADQFAAHVLWMGEGQLLPGRSYWLKLGTRTVGATVSALKHKVDIDTQAPLAATHLALNEVGYCNIALDQAIAFEPYVRNRALGGFILIDRIDNATVAAGTLDFALRRAGNLHWQHIDVDKSTRARSLGQSPRCVWFTGLSGSGKSTIANLVDKRLHALGKHAFVLDGDNVRHGLNRDLGFTDEDRVENLRRVAEVAKLMTDAGLIVLVSFISPFRTERRAARALFGEGEFIEVFVDTPLAVAEERDVKCLYAKARRGELPHFTGIDSPYEAPESPEMRLEASVESPEALAERVVRRLLGEGE